MAPSSAAFRLLNARHHKKLAALLAAGEDANQRSPEGKTLLFEACASEQPAAVQALLEHGANPNLPTADGGLPLHEAMRHNDVALLDRLLDAGADPAAQPVAARGSTALYQGAIAGSLDALKRLAERAGDRLDWNAGVRDGPSPLMGAVNNDQPGIARWLIGQGVDLERPVGNEKATALVQACARGLPQMLDVLLAAGANPNATNAQGQTPLHMLASHDANAVRGLVQQLLDAGADLGALNHRNETPFQTFARVPIHRDSELYPWWHALEEGRALRLSVADAPPAAAAPPRARL